MFTFLILQLASARLSRRVEQAFAPPPGALDTRVLSVLERIALVCAWAGLLIGITIFMGYLLDVPELTKLFMDTVFMTANVSVLLMILSSGILVRLQRTDALGVLISNCCAVFTGCFALAVMFEYLTGVNLGIDLLLFPQMQVELFRELGLPNPGRFAFATSLGLTSLSIALLGLDAAASRVRALSQTAALLAVAVGGLYVIIFAFDAKVPDFVVRTLSNLAPHAAGAMLLLGIALLLARPADGLTAVLASRTLGGIALRRLLLPALFVPLILGALTIRGVHIDDFSPEFGIALFTALTTLLFTAAIWWTCVALAGLDAQSQAQSGELADSERRIRRILDTAQDAVVSMDNRGCISEWYPRMEQLFGWSRAEALGKSMTLIIPERYHEAHNAGLAHFKATGYGPVIGQIIQIEGLSKDGREIPIELAIGVSSPPGGEPEFTAFIRDITERKAAEDRVRASEAALARAQAVAHIGSWQWDIQSNHITWSAELYRIFGLDPAEFQADYESYLTYLHPDDREASAAVIQQAFADCGSFHFEHRLLRPTGEVRYVDSYGECVAGPDGGVVMMRGTAQDVTERKLAELAALESQQHFQSMLDNSPMPIYGKDLEGRYFFANDNTAQMLGRTRAAEILGKSDRDLLDASTAAIRGETFHKALAEGTPTTREEVVHQSDGTRFFHTLKFPLRDAYGTVIGLAGISTDLTARRKMEHELAERNEQMQQLNAEMQLALHELASSHQLLQQQAAALERSNADLDDFAYIASHDLKEPLRGISNYANFLHEDYADRLDAEGVQMLETLPRLTKRLELLLDALLKYSRLNRAELTLLPTDMDDVLTDVREMLETRIAEAGAEIRVPRDLPVVSCDRQQTAEILMNLISNAIKYNEEEQKIVEVGYLDEAPDAAPGEEGPVFYVSDNGIGIADKYLDSIFGAFRRLHGRDKYGGGAGVGLAIVRKMVERQGGRIWVESEPGQGSTFYFTLGQAPAAGEPLSFAWPSEPDQGDSGGI